ncbi:DUF1553 domain-containing protein, partial [Durusdinium trenchii]
MRIAACMLMAALPAFIGTNACAAEATLTASSTAKPTFRRHVLPLLQRLGCSQLSCHGAFHGQGDFRLSLSGRHPKTDWEAVQPYLNLHLPTTSQLLEKPTANLDHGGGKRMEVDSTEYQILRDWIEDGAPLDPEMPAPDLLITPAPIVLEPEAPRPVGVTAIWQDGTTENVTPLVRMEVSPEESFELSSENLITARSRGVSGRVVVEYAGTSTSAPIFSPHPTHAGNSPPLLLDSLFEHDEFARRWGTWLAMTWGCSPEQSPAMRYASGTMHLDHSQFVTCWTDWFAARLREKAQLDDVLRRVLTATTRDDRSFLEHQAWSRDLLQADAPQEFYVNKKSNDLFWRTYASGNQPDDLASVFGATFLGTQFSCAKCHDHPFQPMTQEDYFALNALLDDIRVDAAPRYTHAEKNRLFRTTALIAVIVVAAIGLLTTVACLFRWRWLTRSITSLAACFAVAALYAFSSFAYVVNPDWAGSETAIGVLTGRMLKEAVDNAGLPSYLALFVIPAWEVFIDPNYRQSSSTPRLPDGTSVSLSPGQDPRIPLYEWLITEPNQTAARNIVNRIWAELFGVGLVEPLDEVGTGVTGAHAELLSELTEEFIEHDWSLRHLLRTIMMSKTYQRAVDPQRIETGEYREYASWTPRRLTSLQVMAAIEVATNVRFEFSSEGSLYRYAPLRYGLEPPGRRSGTRALQLLCANHGGDANDSVESALFLLCDPDLSSCLTSKTGRIEQLIQSRASEDEIVETLFAACYGRMPTPQERTKVLQSVRESDGNT